MSATPQPLPNITPPIVSRDLVFYFSGGYYNKDPRFSIGGEPSSFPVVSGSLNGVFDRVNTNQATIGDVTYRCIYLKNTNQTRKLLGTKIWVETTTPSATTNVSVSIGSAGINGVEPMLPNESVQPPMQFFAVPFTQPDTPNIGNLFPGDFIGLWIRWTVNPGTVTTENDYFVIRIDGEREPESLAPPPEPPGPDGCPEGYHLDTTTNTCIPDCPAGTEFDPVTNTCIPITPPPEGCPTGYHFDPITEQCVPNEVPIVCPIGYIYDEATQRCKPVVTPPPTVPLYKVAIVGDFTCGSNAAATINLIKGRLSLTNGENQSLFIANGDLSYSSDQKCFVDLTRNLGDMFPNAIAPTIGNHDDTESGSSSNRTQLINAYPLINTTGYYAITRRNIRFIFMDTQISYGSSSAQFTFVKAQLDAAKADPAIKWVIVCYHKPSLNMDAHHGALTDLRNLYHPLFDANGKVVHVNSGHNHIYVRSKPIKFNPSSPATPIITNNAANGNYVNMTGIIYCTTGTGGRNSNLEFGDDSSYIGASHVPTPYGTTFMTLEDNGNTLSFEYVTNNGQIIDSYKIMSPESTTPPIGGTPTCPEGFHWSEELGRCVASPQTCPTGQHWDPLQQKCVNDTVTEPPPTGGNYPVTNVEWYYDAAPILATDQTISSGDHASDGVLLSSSASGVDSCEISEGWLYIQTGGGNGRVYWDYHTRPRFAQDDQPGFNMAMTFKFKHVGNDNVSVKDGNHGTTGFAFDGQLVFGGFGFSLHENEIQSKVEYWHNSQGSEVSSVYPGNRSLVTDNEYRLFFTLRTDRVQERVLLNVWMDFGDSAWTKIMNDRAWTNSGWNPGSVPDGDDAEQIEQGPSHIKRHHVWIRNNAGGPDLPVTDVKIGTLPYIS